MLSADDRIAIAELVSRFAFASDFGDWAALETVYMPDVVTEQEGFEMRYEGIAAQVEHAKESARQTQGKNRHYYFNVVVEPQGEDVFVNYMFVNVNAGQSPMEAKIVVSGRHRDRVVKSADGWKFAHRWVAFDQSFELNF